MIKLILTRPNAMQCCILFMHRAKLWVWGDSMTDAEKVLVSKLAHEFFDVDVPAVIEVEEQRLPVQYQGLAKLVMSAVMPAIIQAMDAKIDQLTKVA